MTTNNATQVQPNCNQRRTNEPREIIPGRITTKRKQNYEQQGTARIEQQEENHGQTRHCEHISHQLE